MDIRKNLLPVIGSAAAIAAVLGATTSGTPAIATPGQTTAHLF